MALRCFIAITLPEPLKESIGEVIGKLRGSGADVKWVPDAKLHLTLKFLGQTDEGRIDEIRDALLKKLSSYSPFYIKIGGVGCFPGSRHPRVIWVGIEESGALMDIYRAIEDGMTKFGYPREDRPFSPHLTIGRARSEKKMAGMLKIFDENRTVTFDDLEVKGVKLMKSELKPGGAEYTVIAEIPFGGGR